MKVIFSLVAIIVLLIGGLFVSKSLACPWDMSLNSSAGYVNGQSKVFLDKTSTLREDLAANQAEYQALMAQSKPDPKIASNLAREIQKLRNKIQNEAQVYSNSNSNTTSSYYCGRDWGW